MILTQMRCAAGAAVLLVFAGCGGKPETQPPSDQPQDKTTAPAATTTVTTVQSPVAPPPAPSASQPAPQVEPPAPAVSAENGDTSSKQHRAKAGKRKNKQSDDKADTPQKKKEKTT